ncbi:MAG: SCP2 sterol-binding domain-containing protein [Gammaproteobacteria bacterium]|nr:SCP2 sterol-binding domain-containing protein [Gammaproteobacteria bacterium]
MSLILRTLEQGLNLPFQIHPAGRDALAAVEGRTMHVALTAPVLAFDLVFASDRVRVRPPTPPCDVHLTGTAGAFLALARADQHGMQSAAQGIRIEGDIDCALAIRKALAAARPDWEEVLARALGDVPGHWLAVGLTRLATGVRQASLRLARNGAEYLQEESGVLARGDDVEGFLRAVDTLRHDAERLAKRVERLGERA